MTKTIDLDMILTGMPSNKVKRKRSNKRSRKLRRKSRKKSRKSRKSKKRRKRRSFGKSKKLKRVRKTNRKTKRRSQPPKRLGRRRSQAKSKRKFGTETDYTQDKEITKQYQDIIDKFNTYRINIYDATGKKGWITREELEKDLRDAVSETPKNKRKYEIYKNMIENLIDKLEVLNVVDQKPLVNFPMKASKRQSMKELPSSAMRQVRLSLTGKTKTSKALKASVKDGVKKLIKKLRNLNKELEKEKDPLKRSELTARMNGIIESDIVKEIQRVDPNYNPFQLAPYMQPEQVKFLDNLQEELFRKIDEWEINQGTAKV